jgi:pre-rRNA-processing protein TSR2
MDLRSGTRTGPVQQLSAPAKEGFEEGVGIIFSQWTALVLAVENQWGGSESASKADYFIEDILEWFYKKKGEAWRDRLSQAAALNMRDVRLHALLVVCC